jgi:hypothetical protein
VLDLGEIAAELTPGRSLAADPGLLRRLTRTLDRRHLALLAAPGALDRARPFGLRLGVESVVSPEFLKLDAGLPGRLRGRVVVGFTPADVLADPAGFVFARDFARVRGYAVLLRGVTVPLLSALVLPRLGLDLVQVAWTPEVSGLDAAQEGTRLVLGDAHEPAAIEWARERGVSLAQGRAALPNAAG